MLLYALKKAYGRRIESIDFAGNHNFKIVFIREYFFKMSYGTRPARRDSFHNNCNGFFY